MKLIDTHCHLDLEQFDKDLPDVIAKAKADGIERIIIPGIDLESSKKAVRIAEQYDIAYAAIGIHPHEADCFKNDQINAFRELYASSKKIVAIGEIGLDNYRNHSKPENQMVMLKAFMELGKELNLPLILHNRNTRSEFEKLLPELEKHKPKGVMHCFSEDIDFAKKIIDIGYYISFACNITYPKAEDLRQVASKIPIESILLETDAPYLAPEGERGKRNDPSNVAHLLVLLSRLHGLSEQDIARITTHNANTLFGLGVNVREEIAYPIRDSLYINLTNRCTNNCTFCTRDTSDFVKGHNLKIDKEPSYEEVLEAISTYSEYKEIVFCGFGEPTMRLDMVKKIAAHYKATGIKTRLTTNGEGDIINGRSIASEIAGLIDKTSVSLNAPDEELYNKICQPEFGFGTYDKVIEFIKNCIKNKITVEITCLDIIGKEKVDQTRKIAEKLGAEFRLRHFNVVG
ncbi:MAG: YchF/TatD family DNA exonuclease [Candidatus Omnitrophica bacterium]|nr:YchF/TatD family DNA exonuclease [Candidatus Omnitrophota bacterium]